MEELIKELKKQQRELNHLPKLTGLGQWWNEEMAKPYTLEPIR